MTDAELLSLIAAFPDDVKITVTVSKKDLAEALQERDTNPERLVTTRWFADNLGMSRKWWATKAEHVPGAFRDKEGTPWWLPAPRCRKGVSTPAPRGPRPDDTPEPAQEPPH